LRFPLLKPFTEAGVDSTQDKGRAPLPPPSSPPIYARRAGRLSGERNLGKSLKAAFAVAKVPMVVLGFHDCMSNASTRTTQLCDRPAEE
jgi:hypothetical protein